MPTTNLPTPDELRAMPKIVLHDHLDGGLRPATIVELAAAGGYTALPTTDPDELRAWMTRGADRKDLVLYLETFEHTVGVLQSTGALARAARECAEDLAEDGAVYAEVRFAPELHTRGGLSLDAIVEAVVAGFAQGPTDRITVGTLITAMRTSPPPVSSAIAGLAVRWHGRGVVGFDIAGPEAGFPARNLSPALARCRDAGVPLTLHAGEAFGPASIADALDQGAARIGHGVHIADDVAPDGTLGPVARRVRETHVPLELCPTSNVHSGAVTSVSSHPIGRLRELGFAVTINTDNRLMSAVTASSEWIAVAGAFGWTWADAEAVTAETLDAAFVDDTTRSVLRGRLARGFAALR